VWAPKNLLRKLCLSGLGKFKFIINICYITFLLLICFFFSKSQEREKTTPSASDHNYSTKCAEVITDTIYVCDYRHGCQTWALTLREEHRLRVFKNRLLRRMFRPKRNEVTGGWRKLHNEELHNLYSSQSIIRMITSRRMRGAEHAARMGIRGILIGYS
jgi:hypothetical protein